MYKSKGIIFTPEEYRGILGLSGVMFFRMFGLFLVLPIFSVLAGNLESSTPMLIGLAFGAYGLTQALLQIPFGIWSDRIGRKPVLVVGLLLFIAGSVLGAMTDSIYVMIGARFLQGAGAISAAIFALIADLTRPEVRTRANAGIGASIGIAFGLAFFLAPFLGEWVGLSGIFWLITLLAICGLFLVWQVIPSVAQTTANAPTTSAFQMVQTVLSIPSLRTINWGTFVCSVGLSMSFFLIPLLLVESGYEKEELWKIYLPMLLAGVVAMIPAAIIAETRNRFQEVMTAGAFLLLASLLLFLIGQEMENISWTIGALFVFFMGFNIFEPIFPSLVTRLTTPDTKGTASGVYNFSQFIGHFTGATLAGFFFSQGLLWLMMILALFELTFFYLLLSFPNPQKQETTES